MNQSELRSYRLEPEQIERLLESQYGTSIQPVDHAKLRKLRMQHARAAAFIASLKNEKVSTDTPELKNINQEKTG